MKPCWAAVGVILLIAPAASSQSAADKSGKKEVDLPSSKQVQEPIIGQPQRTNSFPTAVALSPDGNGMIYQANTAAARNGEGKFGV
jgi:hypothetical protein